MGQRQKHPVATLIYQYRTPGGGGGFGGNTTKGKKRGIGFMGGLYSRSLTFKGGNSLGPTILSLM